MSATKAKAVKKAAKSKKTIRIRQVRSGIGFDETQKGTLRALGLEKIGRVREYPDNPAIRGMAAKISHLVVIEKD
jgi:large subunit ribosomal protein L30